MYIVYDREKFVEFESYIEMLFCESCHRFFDLETSYHGWMVRPISSSDNYTTLLSTEFQAMLFSEGRNGCDLFSSVF